jgi:hypothetical protein
LVIDSRSAALWTVSNHSFPHNFNFIRELFIIVWIKPVKEVRAPSFVFFVNYHISPNSFPLTFKNFQDFFRRQPA